MTPRIVRDAEGRVISPVLTDPKQIANMETRRRLLARQAKRLLPWWSLVGHWIAQGLYDLLHLREL